VSPGQPRADTVRRAASVLSHTLLASDESPMAEENAEAGVEPTAAQRADPATT